MTSEPIPTTSMALARTIDEAWGTLQAFVGLLTEAKTAHRDLEGWTIKDHLFHISVWEDSVAVLFRGGQRHEALGLEETFFRQASFDQINAILKERHRFLQLTETLTLLTRVHQELMAEVRPLSDAQLATTVRDFFPRAPRDDERTLGAFIYWNTADHYREHLPWMQALLD